MPRLSRDTPSVFDDLPDEAGGEPTPVNLEPSNLPAALPPPELENADEEERLEGRPETDEPDEEKPSGKAPARKRKPELDPDAGRRERRRYAEELASGSIKSAIGVLKRAARGDKVTPQQLDGAKQLIELSAGKTPAAELDKGLKRVLIAEQPKPGTTEARMLRCTCQNCRALRERLV